MKEEPKITGRQYPYRGCRAIPLGLSMQKVLLASTQCSASLRRYRPLRSETERQFRWESTQYSFLKMEKWRTRSYSHFTCTFNHTISDPSTFPPGKQGQGETQLTFLQWDNKRCKNVCYSSCCKVMSPYNRKFWGHTSHKDSGFTCFMQQKASFPSNVPGFRGAGKQKWEWSMSIMNYSLNGGVQETNLSKCYHWDCTRELWIMASFR